MTKFELLLIFFIPVRKDCSVKLPKLTSLAPFSYFTTRKFAKFRTAENGECEHFRLPKDMCKVKLNLIPYSKKSFYHRSPITPGYFTAMRVKTNVKLHIAREKHFNDL